MGKSEAVSSESSRGTKWSVKDWTDRIHVPDALHFRNPFKHSLADDVFCGICGWTPQWLQRFRTMKVFMLIYIVMGVFHGMYGSYMSTVVPSIERRFGFSSKQTGIYRAMADVSRISVSLIVAHYAGAGHRPRWIGGGAVLLAAGMFLMAATEIAFPVTERSIVSFVISSAADKKEKFCQASAFLNATRAPLPAQCGVGAAKPESNVYPLIMLGVSEFIMGLGATTIVILALPFIDDNVTYRNSPLYFAMSFIGRLFGPLFGFGLGAICSSIFFDFTHPNFAQTDPRWIAAWYLGLLVCAVGIAISGIFITMFPSVVRDPSEACKDFSEFEAKRRASIMRKCVTFKDFLPNLKRLFTNLPFMIKLLSQLLEGLVISGYMSFLMKFIKEQYRVSQSTASLATGIPGVFAAAIGIFVGSWLIKFFKMEPRHVQIMTAIAAVIGAASYFIVIAFGCENQIIVGIDDVDDPYNLTNAPYCFNNQSCGCISGQFNPVCDQRTGQTYATACIAGCRAAKFKNNKTKYYDSCTCLSDTMTDFADPSKFNATDSVVPGLCQASCSSFAPYVVVMCLAKLFLGVPIAGIVMMQFRLVDYDLKSLANGLSSVVMSLFGFLPAPIIAGAIIDTTCRYWQKSPCGDTGSCLFYNTQSFRWKLHLIVACFKIVTCVFDLIILWFVWDMKFNRDTPAESLPPKEEISDEISSDHEAKERESKPPLTPKVSFPLDVMARSGFATIREEDSDESPPSEDHLETVSTISAVSQPPPISPTAPKRVRTMTMPARSETPDRDEFQRNRPDMRRKSLAMTMVDAMNAKAIAENHEDTEFLAPQIIDARRGSLLFW
ncbi:solute carrier organic anion transporter family member 3A1-like [Paramacrobiotus metropolitanus]|uniref:solute carrier organic anion transporter family member 3A1-like n=1 Tax=Paramacrobiotus metropolitanus TaxID=2943436 RepID=UPI002445A151|nr:solute carrier organic anion transporter family member 3A1-like [Paramacrobiotus metropolitanus]